MEPKDAAFFARGFRPREWRISTRSDELLRANTAEQLARIAAEGEDREKELKRQIDGLKAQVIEKDGVIEQLAHMYNEKDGQHQAETKRFQRAKALFYAAFEYVPKSKPGTKGALIANVVKRVEEWHREHKKNFDRWNMPGDAGDLLWLMSRLHPEEFEDMVVKSFRPHYKTVCSWKRSAGHQESAKHLYLEVLPQAVTRLAGVESACK